MGLKVRENYECPGATVFLKAHKALENLVLTREEIRFKALIDQEWSRMAYEGLWWDPLKDDLEAFIGSTQTRVTGEVKLNLYKGGLTIVTARSVAVGALFGRLASFDTTNFRSTRKHRCGEELWLAGADVPSAARQNSTGDGMALWGGLILSGETDQVMSDLFLVDRHRSLRLWSVDLKASAAHVRMLTRTENFKCRRRPGPDWPGSRRLARRSSLKANGHFDPRAPMIFTVKLKSALYSRKSARPPSACTPPAAAMIKFPPTRASILEMSK